MELQLVGKRALVTGSSSGIGKAIAAAVAAEGAIVVVHGRDRARVEAAAADIALSLRGRAEGAGQPLVLDGAIQVRREIAIHFHRLLAARLQASS